MFAYTGFNFANMAHPLSIKFIEYIYQFLLLFTQQPLCQRVPPFVNSFRNKTIGLTNGIARYTA